jgi:hypothetical protein
MKHLSTEFIPFVNLSFTDHEIEVMIYCAQHHYDFKCNALTHPEGVLAKMKRIQENFPNSPHRLEFSDMDTINKALEIGGMIVAANATGRQMVDTSCRLKKEFYLAFNRIRKTTPNPISYE